MKTNAMNRTAKSVLFIIGLGAFLYGAFAFAGVRCGNHLVNVGDSYYQIKSTCNIEYEWGSKNTNIDMRKLYFKDGGMTYELIVIDGVLSEINMNRTNV